MNSPLFPTNVNPLLCRFTSVVPFEVEFPGFTSDELLESDEVVSLALAEDDFSLSDSTDFSADFSDDFSSTVCPLWSDTFTLLTNFESGESTLC